MSDNARKHKGAWLQDKHYYILSVPWYIIILREVKYVLGNSFSWNLSKLVVFSSLKVAISQWKIMKKTQILKHYK